MVARMLHIVSVAVVPVEEEVDMLGIYSHLSDLIATTLGWRTGVLL